MTGLPALPAAVDPADLLRRVARHSRSGEAARFVIDYAATPQMGPRSPSVRYHVTGARSGNRRRVTVHGGPAAVRGEPGFTTVATPSATAWSPDGIHFGRIGPSVARYIELITEIPTAFGDIADIRTHQVHLEPTGRRLDVIEVGPSAAARQAILEAVACEAPDMAQPLLGQLDVDAISFTVQIPDLDVERATCAISFVIGTRPPARLAQGAGGQPRLAGPFVGRQPGPVGERAGALDRPGRAAAGAAGAGGPAAVAYHLTLALTTNGPAEVIGSPGLHPAVPGLATVVDALIACGGIAIPARRAPYGRFAPPGPRLGDRPPRRRGPMPWGAWPAMPPRPDHNDRGR